MSWLRLLLFVIAVPAVAQAEDWPQWLGPRRNAGSTDKVAPWRKPLEVLWRQTVGEGHSSPIVVGGKVYLHAKDRNKVEETLAAFDAVKGDSLWEKSYPRDKFLNPFGGGPRATPAFADGRIVTLGITGILTCWDAAEGKTLWQIDTLKEFKANNLIFGISCSPLIEDGKVLINVGGKGAGIVAFDLKDGKVAWKTLDDKASYSSPIAIGEGGERQAVFQTAKGLVGVAVRDGSVFWQFPFEDKLAESSTTPVKIGNVLFGSSITLGSVGLKWDNSQAIPRVEKLWSTGDLTCYFSTPVAVGKDTLYLVSGTKPPAFVNKSFLHCIDAATGKELWKRKAPVGSYHASLTRTGDDKLLLLEENGDLVLVEADRKEYRESARSKICGSTWAHPAVANGRFYIRDGKELVCVKLAE